MKRTLAILALVLTALAAAPASANPPPGPLGDLMDMDEDERKVFYKVLNGELCPCGNAMSLGMCLSREDVCQAAVDVSLMVATKVRQGLTYTEVVDHMISYLEKRSKPQTFDLTNTPMKGAKDAKIVLVEFADFECGHCNRARPIMLKALRSHPGKVALYFKHYPLKFHEHAARAAQVAEVARRKGKFWPVHDAIFDSQGSLSEAKLMDILSKNGVDPKSVTDAEWADATAAVAKNKAEGEKAGIQGTPSVFLNGIELTHEELKADPLVKKIAGVLKGL